MAGFHDATYAFLLAWEDRQASLVRNYRMTFYDKENGVPEIELYDIKTRRIFLKRMAYPSIRRDQLFVGAFVTIYARQMKIVDYGDLSTRKRFESATTLGLICQFSSASAPALRDICTKFSFQNVKLMEFSAALADELAKIINMDGLRPILTSGPVLALELRSRSGGNCTDEWHKMIAQLQSKYEGTFVGASRDAEERASRSLFNSASKGLKANLRACSVCVVKPHCVVEGNFGNVVADIVGRGLSISGMRLLTLSNTQAAEFLEVYNGVVPGYEKFVQELSSGPCVALEVSGDAEVVQRLRAIAGPIDNPTAQRLRKGSLRAKYGNNTFQSGVHVTDLPEDGELESQYLFSILPSSN